MTATRQARVPGFDLVVPGEWWRIPLRDPRAREAAVTELVRRRSLDADLVDATRHETVQALTGAARDAAAEGATVWWISTQVVQGIPMPVSALATPVDPPRVRDLGHVAEDLAGRPGVVQARLRPGPVIRQVYRRTPGEVPEPVGGMAAVARVPELSAAPVLQADYWVGRPDGRVLLMAYASPLVRFEDALLEMFDAVTDTVTWREP